MQVDRQHLLPFIVVGTALVGMGQGMPSAPVRVQADVRQAQLGASEARIDVTNDGWAMTLTLVNTGALETSSTVVSIALPDGYRYGGSSQEDGVVRTEGRTYGTDVLWNVTTVQPSSTMRAVFYLRRTPGQTRRSSIGISIVPRFGRTVYARVTPPAHPAFPPESRASWWSRWFGW